MKHLNVGKRFLAFALAFVMVMGLVPVLPITLDVGAVEEGADYVSLPVTIRDYAADGMLFEYNEIGTTGSTYAGWGVPPFASFNASKSMVGGADTASKNGNIITIVRNKANYNANAEKGRYLKGNLSGDVHYGNNLRYMAIKYSLKYAASGAQPWLRFYNDGVEVASFPLNYICDGTVHNLVLDIGWKNVTVDEIRLCTGSSSGGTFTLYWCNMFGTEAEAKMFQASGGQGSRKYLHQNTVGFGLLSTVAASFDNNMFKDISSTSQDIDKNHGIAGSAYYRNGKWGSTYPSPIDITLSNGAKQTLYGGVIRTDLVESYLVNGKPVYTQGTVDYLADYLSVHLQVPWHNGNSSYNMWYVMGEKLSELGNTDLASKLRAQIAANGNAMGTYAEAKAAFGTEALDHYSDIDTYYEAAYFLLHNTFTDNVGYGKTVDCYNEIRLVEKTEGGKTFYVFNSGYNDTAYDTTMGTIYNTQTSAADYHANKASNATAIRGNPWYKNRFDPLNPKYVGDDAGYGLDGDTYRDASQHYDAEESFYYDDTNYNLSLEGHAQFVYYYEDDLYFTFTGDDDVYLYINGIRVLDMGAAHSISKATINVNDVAKLCGLRDGGAYSFDFYYMERHGTAANFSIETNIHIVDPSMVTTKEAYQDRVAVGYKGFVDAAKPVEYLFGLENKGEAHLKNLTFTDDAIGVAVTPTEITLNSETTMDMIRVAVYNADGSVKFHDTSVTEEELKTYLATGLDVGEEIKVYGFHYTIPEGVWSENYFTNVVYSTAEGEYASGKTRILGGFADWVVRRRSMLFPEVHLYDHGKLEDGAFVTGSAAGVTLTREELLNIGREATDAYGGSLSTTTYFDHAININSHTQGEYFKAAGYVDKVFLLTEWTDVINLGRMDLSQYYEVVIKFGTDARSTCATNGSQFYLTKNKKGVQGKGEALINTGDIIAKSTGVPGPTAAWASGTRECKIALNTTYQGTVYFDYSCIDSHGVAVSSITFKGKTGEDFSISDSAIVKLCSPTGAYEGAVCDHATVNADYSITYESNATGAHAYYYNIVDGSNTYGPIAVNVYTYAVSDSAFVMDYDMPITIFGGEYDVTYDDVVDIALANPFGTTYKLTATSNPTANYGDFTVSLTDGTVSYALNEETFFEGLDTIEITLEVLETGATEVTKTTGVTMTQTITMAPANVMYYEDDFDSITYINTGSDADGNIWAVYEGAWVGNEQSADQDSNYGSDPHYNQMLSDYLTFAGLTDATLSGAVMADVQAKLDAIFNGSVSDWEAANGPDYPYPEGELLGDASNDTLHVLNIRHKGMAEIMSFEFTGTGFEIISRTTDPYAVLTVKVEQKQADGTYKTTRVIPVISECINADEFGDLTQVPLITFKNADYGTYKVTVISSNARADKDVNRVTYVDGIRIYQPLTQEVSDPIYANDEKRAEFHEIKTQINSGDVVFGEVVATPDADGNTVNRWGFGATVIENQNMGSNLTNTTLEEGMAYDKSEYMAYGPNNEIYLSTVVGSDLNFIALYLAKDESVADADRSIQIGAHYKFDGSFWDDGVATLLYGSRATDFQDGGLYSYDVASATEQYFTIDTSALVETVDGKSLLIIGTDDVDVLALTNIKLNGYTICGGIDSELEVLQDIYDANASTLVRETLRLFDIYASVSTEENEQ